MKKASAQYIAIICTLLLMSGCASKPPLSMPVQPSLKERLEMAFNPPWWYKGPVRTVYNKLYPPPWYQGSLDWMAKEVNEICDAQIEAFVRASASASATGSVAAPTTYSIMYGVVRMVSTTGAITYCRLRS